MRGMGVSLDQSLRWCAAGFGCPEGMTQDDAIDRIQRETDWEQFTGDQTESG
ncbi:hypothetical protein ABWH92_17590 [Ahrensia marina]|uniref:hypothetical protein n=1 Tax=Ahrensia marina TaxID=1514904 RepID=UPI0035CFB4AF